MKSHELNQQISEALQELDAALEQGRSDQLQRYLEAMARFPRYSLGNVLLIASQCPEASQVAGFRTWQRLGRYVRPGEKAIRILAPVRRKKDDGQSMTDDAAQAPKVGTDRPRIVGFRPACVFDISQTHGKALPEPAQATGDAADHLHRLEAFVQSLGVELAEADLGPTVDGTSSGGKITLRPGLAPPARLAVLTHELAHELLHQIHQQERPNHRKRETEAEAVAFVVCHALGLSARTAASDYIQLHGGDQEVLASSLRRIQSTAADILEAVAPPPRSHTSPG